MGKDYNLERRKYVIGGIILSIWAIYIIRLLSLQVFDKEYKQYADSNAFMRQIEYPSRGLMYDRNGKLVVFNQPAYDVMMIMREVQPFDTLDFCRTVNLTREQFDKRLAEMKNRRLNPGYSTYTPQVFMTQLSVADYGRLQEKLYRFPGFYIQNRFSRVYNYPVAANVLGNTREVSQKEIKSDSYYIQGDYTGDLGIERSYESVLRGEKGVEVLLRDAHGRIKGRYEEGRYDVKSVPGKDLTLSIDIELQAYGEQLMQNKIGAIVAIEPATGEVLALVSSPSFNPSGLVGRERGQNYAALNNDPYKPLYDRAIMAAYPPGSTFKPTQGLIFLNEGIVSTQTRYPCFHGFVGGGLKVGCHPHETPLALNFALATSCNAYFCYGLRDMMVHPKYGSVSEAFEVWKKHLVSMGYGYRLGIDLPGENRGFIPNSAYFNKIYNGSWNGVTVISLAIGQGEVLATPLQIANLSATIANRGYFYVPHVVKGIQGQAIDSLYTRPHYTTVGRNYYEEVVEGMREAVVRGTCRWGAIPGIEMCGKTGTAQNPHGEDHSAFMGFAPKDNPQIAIAVYVENAGYGATYGVPIGSLMMEMYLNRRIAPERKWIEKRMLEANTIIDSGVTKH